MKLIHIFSFLILFNFFLQIYSYDFDTNFNTNQNNNYIQCSEGCLTECIANNTCSICKTEYENDNSCYKCKKTDIITDQVYLNNNGKCISNTNILQKTKVVSNVFYQITFF